MSFIQALQDIFSLPAIEAAAWGCATCFLISVLLVLTKKLHGSATMDLSNGFKSEVDAPGQDKTLKHVPSYPPSSSAAVPAHACGPCRAPVSLGTFFASRAIKACFSKPRKGWPATTVSPAATTVYHGAD